MFVAFIQVFYLWHLPKNRVTLQSTNISQIVCAVVDDFLQARERRRLAVGVHFVHCKPFTPNNVMQVSDTKNAGAVRIGIRMTALLRKTLERVVARKIKGWNHMAWQKVVKVQANCWNFIVCQYKNFFDSVLLLHNYRTPFIFNIFT